MLPKRYGVVSKGRTLDPAAIHARRPWTLAVMGLILMVVRAGGLGDRFGRRRAPSVGLLIFGSVIALVFLPSRARLETEPSPEHTGALEADREVASA